MLESLSRFSRDFASVFSVEDKTVKRYHAGFEYARNAFNQDPSKATYDRLWVESDNPFDSDGFERGMKAALRDIPEPKE